MLWVILVLSILAVANRIYYTYLALNKLPMPSRRRASRGVFNRAFFWTDERDDAALRPVGDRDPGVRVADAADWLGDPTAPGMGLWALLEP